MDNRTNSIDVKASDCYVAFFKRMKARHVWSYKKTSDAEHTILTTSEVKKLVNGYVADGYTVEAY